MKRINISSGTRWEPIVGYSRAVRVGNHIAVAGTTAFDNNGNIVGVGDPHTQTVQIMKNIESALHKAGASLKDVVRTRIFFRNSAHWETIAKVHGETFRNILPAATAVEVSGFVHPDMLVEIEADAVVIDP